MDQPARNSKEFTNHPSKEKTCLILLAHGSRDPRWQEPFERLFVYMRQELGDHVKLAYMEFVDPTLSAIAEECSKEGVSRLRILPIFMAVGAHLAQDVPKQARKLAQQFPNMKIEVLPPVGEDPRMFLLMQQIIRDQAA